MAPRGTAARTTARQQPPTARVPLEATVALEVQNVSHAFRTPAGETMQTLQDVSLTVRENEFFTVVGPSGCGKSTLLNIAVGLIRPDSGTVRIGAGEPASPAGSRPTIGYITQDSSLLPWCTVLENIMVGLEVRKVPKAERRRRASEWARLVGLAGFERHYPRQLSGGMQKRCSIARTMVYDPDIVFMDEPFSALDAITRTVIQTAFLRLCEARRKTIIFITHDLTEAIALSDRVAVMSGRPGRIKDIVDVPFDRPRDIQHVTQLPGFDELRDRLWSMLDVDLPDDADATRPS